MATASSKSGNPETRAKAAAARSKATAPPTQATSASGWKKSSKANETKILRLPSGNNVEARVIGPETFMAAGAMPDSMAPMISEAIRNGKGLPPKKLEAIAKDPKMVADALGMIDKGVLRSVVQPEILPLPADGEERDPDALYIDEIEIDDKNFIFQWAAGGTADLATFRREQRSAMGNLSTR